MVYAVVDIETTGGSHGNRITEIAIVKTDGKQILDQYETLVNPEIFIPKSISLLTGITNAMVEHEPTFQDVADEIEDYLVDAIFVAHNVSFDYGIIKNHFEDIGRSFNRKKLCSVRLAKGIIPGHPSYSLGKICKTLGIRNENRHRAMGDAKATVELLHLLIAKDTEDFISYSLNQLNKEAVIPPNLEKREYEELPTRAGVYYMHGENMEVLYVGKAKNIKQRMNTHFGEKSRKKSELLRKIHHVSFEETGNELVALLLESDEIKQHFPPYNKAQKYKQNNYHVCYYEGQDGVIRIDVFMKKYANNSILSFSSMVMAKDFLYKLVEKYELCPKRTGLEKTRGNCYLGTQCKLCGGEETPTEYNYRVLTISEEMEGKQSMLILGKGRYMDERAVVYIKEGDYQGFGFVDETADLQIDDLIECIQPYKNTNDIKRILNSFLANPLPKDYEVIILDT